MTLVKGASPTEANKPIIVLVHGLHQTPLIMMPMARFFDKQGCQAVLFGYRSWHGTIASHTQKLAKCLNTLPNDCPLYLVGHSLGGLLIHHYMCTHTHRIGHAVTLGSPHLGSRVAHRLHTVAPFVLGRAYVGALDGSLSQHNTPANIGCIAGNRSLGLGRYFYKDTCHEHDGTVFVAETKLTGAPHLVLPVGHTSMLFDRQVYEQTQHFLRFGFFDSKNAANLRSPAQAVE